MQIGLAVHGWYHPLAETDTYITSLCKALESIGIYANIIDGFRLPYDTISQFIFPPICRYVLKYRDAEYDIIHDTRGDSVFRGVDVATITDLYWNQIKEDLHDKITQIPIKFFQDYRRTLKVSRRIIVLNSMFKEEIKKYFGNEFDHKVRVIPVPMSPSATSLNNERIYDVIWVGSTDRRKQLLLFLNYIDKLPKKYKIGIRVNYLNKRVSDNHRLIHDKISQLRLSGYTIHSLDFVRSWELMDNLYKSSKCLVSTSVYEGFHLPVAEAYLRGVHVILPRNELYSSIYGDEVGVHYYDEYSQLPRKISEAFESGSFTPSKKIINYLSYENVGKMLKTTYEEAMNY